MILESAPEAQMGAMEGGDLEVFEVFFGVVHPAVLSSYTEACASEATGGHLEMLAWFSK